MTHIPYKGSAPALTDMLSGQIQVLFNTVSTTLSHVRAGAVRALATTGTERLEALPNVPTVAESGLAGYENTTWSAIGAPAQTPRTVIERLNAEIGTILQTPVVRSLPATRVPSFSAGHRRKRWRI